MTLFFFPLEVLNYIFFPIILCQCGTLVNCWRKMCKDAKIKKCSALIYCKFGKSLLALNAWAKKCFRNFNTAAQCLDMKIFINNFFLCSTKVIYMTNFIWQMIVWGLILELSDIFILAELIFEAKISFMPEKVVSRPQGSALFSINDTNAQKMKASM